MIEFENVGNKYVCEKQIYKALDYRRARNKINLTIFKLFPS